MPYDTKAYLFHDPIKDTDGYYDFQSEAWLAPRKGRSLELSCKVIQPTKTSESVSPIAKIST